MKNTIAETFIFILLVGCLGQFAADIYSPSIPSISTYFHVSVNLVQLSMSIYMLGVSVSLLVYGPLSEGYGRKIPLLCGLAIALVGTLLCFFASNIYVLILGRFIQGTGIGAGTGLWRAIFRDTFKGEELAKYGSYLVMGVMFIIPAAPLVGGYLQHYYDWQSIFIFLFIYTLIILGLVYFRFSETSQHHDKSRLKSSYILSTYKHLFTHRTFLSITLCVFITCGGFFSWFVVGPVLLIHLLHLTPAHFGWLCFIAGAISFTSAGMLNARFVKRYGMRKMMYLGWSMMILGGVLMLLGKWYWGINLWAIYIPTVIFYFGCTFIWPNAFAAAMTPFGDIAGYAGTSYSFMQLGGAALITAVVAHLPDTNQVPLGWVYILCGAGAMLVYQLGIGSRN